MTLTRVSGSTIITVLRVNFAPGQSKMPQASVW